MTILHRGFEIIMSLVSRSKCVSLFADFLLIFLVYDQYDDARRHTVLLCYNAIIVVRTFTVSVDNRYMSSSTLKLWGAQESAM